MSLVSRLDQKKREIATVNLGIEPEIFDSITKNNEESILYGILGFHLLEVGPGTAKLDFKVEPQHVNFWQMVHGGVIGVLVDAAMGASVRSLGIQGVTIDLITHYLASAQPGDTVRAEGRIVSQGKRVLVAEAEVRRKDGVQIAMSRATFYNKGPLLK